MMRLVACFVVLALAPVGAHPSEPRRRLLPEVCEADERPALTSLAVPEPVRASAHRAELIERGRRRRRPDRPIAPWLLAAAAAAAALLVLRAR